MTKEQSKRRQAALALLIGVAACATAPLSSSEPALVDYERLLDCERWAKMTRAGLVRRFGATNVSEQKLSGVEGESYIATVVFADSEARRVELTWQSANAGATPSRIRIAGAASVWTGPQAVRLGDTLVLVEHANGGPFMLYGFGWDFGGGVSDWKNGRFARDECDVGVRFDATAAGAGAQGDREFSSETPAVRRAEPIVVEIALVFRPPR